MGQLIDTSGARRRRRGGATLHLVDRALSSCSEAELIAQLLSGTRPDPEAVRRGEELLGIPGWRLRELGASGLAALHGLPAGQAVRMAALAELFERRRPDERPSVGSPREALLLLEGLRRSAREQVMVILLDARHRLLGSEVVAVGTLNASRLCPRDVLAPAMRAEAAGMVLGHNHPSGDPAPSRADRLVTAAIRSAGDLVGVPLLDHLIVARSGHHSFRESEAWDSECPPPISRAVASP